MLRPVMKENRLKSFAWGSSRKSPHKSLEPVSNSPLSVSVPEGLLRLTFCRAQTT